MTPLPWWLVLLVGIIGGWLLSGWAHRPPAPLPPPAAVTHFDSTAIAAKADSTARAQSRQIIDSLLARIRRSLAQHQRDSTRTDSILALVRSYQVDSLSHALSCSDSTRILLLANVNCARAADSLKQQNHDLQMGLAEAIADGVQAQALGAQAEGQLSQVRSQAKDAIAALGTRLDQLTRAAQPSLLRLGAAVQLGLAGACWTGVMGPDVTTRRKVLFAELEASGTVGIGAGGCGIAAPSAGLAGAGRLALTF